MPSLEIAGSLSARLPQERGGVLGRPPASLLRHPFLQIVGGRSPGLHPVGGRRLSVEGRAPAPLKRGDG
jgi:hypothetical protein